MKNILSNIFKFNTSKPAELVIGKREAVQGNVDTQIMVRNLKIQYQAPYTSDEISFKSRIENYQDTL